MLSKNFLTSISHDLESESHFFKLLTFTRQIISRGSPHVAKFFVAKIFTLDSLHSADDKFAFGGLNLVLMHKVGGTE